MLALAIAGLVAAACGSDDDGEDEASSSSSAPTETTVAGQEPEADEPVSGGTLTYLRSADASSLDPIRIGTFAGSDAVPAAVVYDLLMYVDAEDGLVKNQVAESLTSDDALVWTLTLKPDVMFSDGTPYDAAAVEFNWLRLQDPANAAIRAAQANVIESMEVVDATTLEITLKEPNSAFPQIVAQIPFIASPTAIEAAGGNYGLEPVGAGPFLVSSWTPASTMNLERNPDYWNAPLPYLDGLVFNTITDETQRVSTYQSGAGDLLYTVVPGSAAQMPDDAVEHPTLLNGGAVVLFNTRRPPFDDLRARQAVSLAIDRAEYVRVVDNDAIPAMDSIFADSSPFFDDALAQADADEAEAQALFDELAEENGGPLTFTISTIQSATFPVGAEYIQGVLRGFDNVEVEVQSESIAQGTERALAGDFDIEFFGNTFLDPVPGWTSVFTCGSAGNFTGYCNEAFDEHIANQQQTLDEDERITELQAAQELFYADIPGYYVERRVNFNFAEASVRDLAIANDGIPLFDRIWRGDE